MKERAGAARDFEKLRAIFDRAAELPADQRRGFLEEIRGVDPALLTGVERLLARDAELMARNAGDLPRFGAYQAIRRLGRGGMGVVYEAHRDDGAFERRVAIKVLPSGTLSQQPQDDLRAERQVLSGLVHPGIAQLFDGGVTAVGDPYLVVELIDGEHLDDYCDRRQLSAADRLALLKPVLDAIEFAHASGVIHLDLKPSNILVTPAGQPKLIDFGLATLPDSTRQLLRLRYTPEYAAPELMSGGAVDGRTDIHALGVIYARLLGDSAKSKVVRRATAANPVERYQSIGELRRALFGQSSSPHRARWTAAALSAALTLLMTGVWWRRQPRPPALVPVSPSEASWRGAAISAPGGWWAFADGESSPDHHDIWACREDGSELERLTQDDHRDEDPTISADGRFVAFRSNRDSAGIHEFDRTTRQVRVLTAGGHQPKYSPDGRWLLYATSDDRDDESRAKENQWFVMPARGGAARAVAEHLRITHAFWTGDSQAVWLRGTKANALHSSSVWRQPIDGEEPTLEVDWPNKLDPCAEAPGGDALLAVRLPEYALMRIPVPRTPRAAVVAAPAHLVDTPAQPSGCSVTQSGRIYLHRYDWLVKDYLLPAPLGSRPPRELTPASLGIRGASRDGRTIIQKTGEFDMTVTGPFGSRSLPGTPAVSGDGRVVWLARNELHGHATAFEIRKDFRILRESAEVRTIWSASDDGSFALAFDGSYPRKITALPLEREARADILAHPRWNLYRARLSANSQWVTFTVHDPARGLRIHSTPFRGLKPVPVAEWKDLAEGTSPTFSPSGDQIIFTSARDGNWCIYALPLVPGTIRPAGEAMAVAHLHGPFTASEMPGSTFMVFSSEDGVRFSVGRQRHRVFEYVAP